MEPKDNITKLPQSSDDEMAKQLAAQVKEQKDKAKAIVDKNDFVLVLAFKATGEEQSPISFTDMVITSTTPQLPLLPILAASSETLNEQFNREIDGLKKNFAANAKAKR